MEMQTYQSIQQLYAHSLKGWIQMLAGIKMKKKT